MHRVQHLTRQLQPSHAGALACPLISPLTVGGCSGVDVRDRLVDVRDRLVVQAQVREALDLGKPVVALESTIISHGARRPFEFFHPSSLLPYITLCVDVLCFGSSPVSLFDWIAFVFPSDSSVHSRRHAVSAESLHC